MDRSFTIAILIISPACSWLCRVVFRRFRSSSELRRSCLRYLNGDFTFLKGQVAATALWHAPIPSSLSALHWDRALCPESQLLQNLKQLCSLACTSSLAIAFELSSHQNIAIFETVAGRVSFSSLELSRSSCCSRLLSTVSSATWPNGKRAH